MIQGLSALLGFIRSAAAALPRVVAAGGRAFRSLTILPRRAPQRVVVVRARSEPTVTQVKPEKKHKTKRRKQANGEKTKRGDISQRGDVLESAAEQENARELARKLAELRGRQRSAPTSDEQLTRPTQPETPQEKVSKQVGRATAETVPPPLPPTPPPLPPTPPPLPPTPPPLPTVRFTQGPMARFVAAIRGMIAAPPRPQGAPMPASPRTQQAAEKGLPADKAVAESPQESESVRQAKQKTESSTEKLEKNTEATEKNTEALKQQEKAAQELSNTGHRLMRWFVQGLVTPMALSSLSKAVESIAQGILARYAEAAKFAPQAQWSMLRLQHQQTLLTAQSVRTLSGPLSKLADALADAQRAWAPVRNLFAGVLMSSLTQTLHILARIGDGTTRITRSVNELIKTLTFGLIDLNKWMEEQNQQSTSIAAEFFGRLTRSDWHGLVPPARPQPRFERPFGPMQPPPRR